MTPTRDQKIAFLIGYNACRAAVKSSGAPNVVRNTMDKILDQRITDIAATFGLIETEAFIAELQEMDRAFIESLKGFFQVEDKL